MTEGGPLEPTTKKPIMTIHVWLWLRQGSNLFYYITPITKNRYKINKITLCVLCLSEVSFTCKVCWRPSRIPAHHTRKVSPSCGHEHESLGCRRWERLCRSPAGCTQRCIHHGVFSDVFAGFLLCYRCACSPQTCTGTSLPARHTDSISKHETCLYLSFFYICTSF